MKEVISVSNGNDKFSTNLYQLLRKKQQNLIFSPFSISVVMAMLSAGAKGETLKQIKKVFFSPFPHSPDRVQKSPTILKIYKGLCY